MENTQHGQASTARAAQSRGQFLTRAGAGAFVALAATSLSPLRDGIAFAHSNAAGLTDVQILNFALGLEHLEATFYGGVVTSGLFSGTVLKYLTTIHNDELAHVAALTAAIKQMGGTPAAAMTDYKFGDLSSADKILALAEKLEITGVGAYTGAAGLLNNKALVAAAGSIEQVEARHYATIRLLRDEDPAPEAIGPILTVAQVQAAVNPLMGMM